MVSVKIISPITNYAKGIYQKIPSYTVSGEKLNKAVSYIGKKITSPQQRVILGATAILTQPLIDAHNKRVDDETKVVSVAKTISKILVGTLTGFFVRSLTIKAQKTLAKTAAEVSKDAKPIVRKLQTCLTPREFQNATKDEISQYRNAMGTIISLLIMLITNFKIDAPWTNRLTNYLLKNPTTHSYIEKFAKTDTTTKEGGNK